MFDRLSESRLQCTIDLTAMGVQVGDLLLRHSDDAVPLGFRPIPIATMAYGTGPVVLLIGGVHGDEYEGPAALLRLMADLAPAAVSGRLIFLPALNMPAVMAARRTSPLDGGNLNRAFPGDPDGGPTAQLAHFVETVLLPSCDAVIDLHAGGQASVFAPCALPSRHADATLMEKNLALAVAFGAPFIWLLGAFNDDRSVNAAAARVGVPMIAAELGGGGGCDPALTDLAEAGVLRCLAHLGVLGDAPDQPVRPRVVEIKGQAQNLYAPVDGLFDRFCTAGEMVEAGKTAGVLYPLNAPSHAPVPVVFPVSGLVLAHSNRGYVTRGDMLALVATDVEDDDVLSMVARGMRLPS